MPLNLTYVLSRSLKNLSLFKIRNIKIFCIFILNTLILNSVHAAFDQYNDYCTITSSFSGVAKDKTEFTGVLTLSFTDKNIVLPVFYVSLSQNMRPTEMNISWPDAKLQDSKNRPLFESSFQKRLEEEKGKVFELSEAQSIFYSKPYGFYRFQNFIALFLSQSNFKLTFKDSGTGQTEEIFVPLAGSDTAFKEITRHCYKNVVENYIINSSGLSVHQLWEMGYGISIFSEVEQYMPDEVKFPHDASAKLQGNYNVTYDKLSDAYILLKQKSGILASIETIASNPDYVRLQETVAQNAENVLSLQKQRDALANPNGTISNLKMQLEALNVKITATNKTITTYESDLNPMAERIEVLKIKLEEAKKNIDLFQENISKTEKSNEEYEANIKTISDIISKYTAEYSEQKNNQETEPLAAPYSIEEIEKSTKAIDEQMQERRNLAQLIQVLESLSVYVNELVNDHKVALEKANELSLLKAEKAKAIEALAKLKLQENQLIELVGNISFQTLAKYIDADKLNPFPELSGQASQPIVNSNATETSAENETTEVQAEQVEATPDLDPKNLTNENAKKLVLDSVKLKYQTYDALLDEAKRSNESIVAKILCKSEYFVSSYKGQCLNPSSVKDSKKVQIYLDEINSANLTEMSRIITGRYSLIQKYDTNIIDLVSARIAEEMNQDLTKELLSQWEDILYTRWKYLAIRPLEDQQKFKIGILDSILEKQIAELEKIHKNQQDQSSKIAELEAKVNSLNSEFLGLEAKYFSSLEKNQNQVLLELNQTTYSPYAINLDCLLNITNVDACAETFRVVRTDTSTKYDQLNQNVQGAVRVLILASQKQLVELQDNLTKSLQRLDELTVEKEDFIISSKFDIETGEYAKLKDDFDRQKVRLASLKEEKTGIEKQITEAVRAQVSAESEHKSLVDEIQKLVDVMQPALVQLKPLCDGMKVHMNELAEVENKIYKIFDINRSPSPVSNLCQFSL